MDTSKKYYEDKIRDFNKYRIDKRLSQLIINILSLIIGKIPDRGGADKAEDWMKEDDKATGSAAQELEKAINDTYHLVVGCLETLNAKAASLIKDIKSGRLTWENTEFLNYFIPDYV